MVPCKGVPADQSADQFRFLGEMGGHIGQILNFHGYRTVTMELGHF